MAAFIPVFAAVAGSLASTLLSGGGSAPSAPALAPPPAPPPPPEPEKLTSPEAVIDEDAARIRAIKRRQAVIKKVPTDLDEDNPTIKTLLGE